MTLPDIDELLLPYLADHPPLHLVAAALAGVKPRRQAADNTPQAWREAMAAVGHGGDVHAGFREPVILDFDRLKAEAAKKRSA